VRSSRGGSLAPHPLTPPAPFSAAVEVTKLDVREDSLRFVSMTRHFRHRGDVLNKPTITSTLSSPLAGVVELHASHFLVRLSLRAISHL
jgi:hypothetical protein